MQKWLLILLSIISIVGYLFLGYHINRADSTSLIGAFTLLFIGYFLFIKKCNKEQYKVLIGLAILFRLLFLFSIPILSDDYFRFIWDGHLILQGMSPFEQLPVNVALDFPNKMALLNDMNSPNYYSVYPPIAQYVFSMGAFFGADSILGNIIVMRSILIGAEIGTLILLPRLLDLYQLPKSRTLLFALNPLVIVEISGNLHFEGLMIFFLLLAFIFIKLKKNLLSIIPWVLGAATKLIPILLLPALLPILKFKKSVSLYLFFLVLFILLWVPFADVQLLSNYYESIQLYHATFEFNASIYYLVRWIGYQFTGYNIIGTAGSSLSIIALIGMVCILLLPIFRKSISHFKAILFALTFYYALALIVHPWYICLLVFFALFTNYKYAYVWSFLIVVSYTAYNNLNYEENYLLIAFEYLLTFLIMGVELMRNKGEIELNSKE